MGRGEADLPHRFAAQPVVPVADLAVITTSGQQGDFPRVVVAGHQVVRTLQLQHRGGGILCHKHFTLPSRLRIPTNTEHIRRLWCGLGDGLELQVTVGDSKSEQRK